VSFLAKYPGVCSACDERFPVNTEVEYDADNDLVHVDCPALIPAAPRAVCPHCFMELPITGKCSCRE
jgi:hypothetical protein